MKRFSFELRVCDHLVMRPVGGAAKEQTHHEPPDAQHETSGDDMKEARQHQDRAEEGTDSRRPAGRSEDIALPVP